jgi:hypothetical protein
VKIIIALVVVGALIGGYFIVVNMDVGEEDEYELPDTISVSDFDEEELSKIRIVGDDYDLTILHADEEWALDWPYEIAIQTRTLNRIVYGIGSISALRVIDEDPADYAPYGLDDPPVRAEAHFTSGEVRAYLFGKQAPSREGYYMKSEDESTVYLVGRGTGGPFYYTLEDLRDKSLPQVDPQQLQEIYIAKDEAIHVVPVTEDDDFLGLFSSLKMIEPFVEESPISTDALGRMVEALPTFEIDSFVEDRPEDLGVYGLGADATEFRLVDANGNAVHMFVGDETDGGHYVKLADKPEVFTIADDFTFLETTPFELVSKFALIVNIDEVDEMVIETPERNYRAVMVRETLEPAEDADEDEEPEVETTYFLNDQEVGEELFKDWYQKVIGLIVEAWNRDPVTSEPTYRITYYLNRDDIEEASVAFAPFDRNFYKVIREGGVSEFLISRRQLEEMVDFADGVLDGSITVDD